VVNFLFPGKSFGTMTWRHRFPFVAILRLRPALIRASCVLPSTPPLSQRVERHFLDGQFGEFY
jgi:hypothetical protein